MNNELIYYYNLQIKEVYPKNEDYLIFTSNDQIFLLKKFNKELININEVLQLTKKYNIQCCKSIGRKRICLIKCKRYIK